MTDKELRAAKRDLAKLIDGPVLSPSDPEFATAVSIDNGRITLKPYLIAIPASTKGVAKIVSYCYDNDLRLTTKSGGHGAAGYCLNADGIVLDLSNLNSIRSTDHGSELTAGTGARWIQVYDYLQDKKSEFMAVGGGCGTVGLGGYLLGGGYSFISRSFGLASDSVNGMEFVAADGKIYYLDGRLTDRNEIDLFWALRGAGGGNFGIVTTVDLQLHKTHAPNLMMGQIGFPIERLSEILNFYDSWVLTLPNEMAAYGMIRRFPDPRKAGKPTLSLQLNPIYNGDFSRGLALLRPLTEMQPTSVELFAMTLPEWEAFIGNGTSIKGRSAYIRSAILAPGSITSDVANIFTEYLSTAPSDDSFIVWTHTGGKIKELRDDISSFAHRDAEFVFELKAVWDASAPQKARGNIEWAVDFFDEVEKHSQGAYLNYIDPLLENWQTKYYRHFYKRLLDIKKHWDPKHRFDFQQGIGSNFSPNRSRPLDLSPLLGT